MLEAGRKDVPVLEREIVVKAKRQLTLPRELADEMEVDTGSRLVATWDRANKRLIVRRIPTSYRGALRGAYGASHGEIQQSLERERASWATGWVE